MNLIYHRNCLDGSYSSLILYLLSRVVQEEEMNKFKDTILALRQKFSSNLTHLLNTLQQFIDSQIKYKQAIVNEDFFHQKRGVPLATYSIFAGDYYPLKFPNGSKIVFILDTTLVSAENIAQICKTHELVILIDHHTSFKEIQQKLDCLQIKNFVYFFDQNYCASKLALQFVDKFFRLKIRLEKSFVKKLQKEVKYVSANDLKKNQTRESKSFVLGFYYFDLELSHLNPNLYKRIGLLDLQYALTKGKNLYKQHLKEIQDEISRAKVCQFNINGFFKNKKCFYLEPKNPTKISDIGTVLSYLSAQEGLLNLAVLALKKQSEVRISCRSHRLKAQPMALQFAKIFNGGGHKEAAGCKITANDMRSRFKLHSNTTVSTKFNLSIEQIQSIFLGKQQQQQIQVQQEFDF